MSPNRNQATKGQTMATPEAQALQAIDSPDPDTAPTGRPTMFSESLSAFICGELAAGKTLTAICRTPGLPVPATVHRWRRENSVFSADYALARADQMESWGDDCIEIADDSTLDTMQGVDKQGNSIEVANHANVQRDRLRVDTRKFIMGKIAPRLYGDRVSHEHSGEVLQRHTIELSDRERMRRLATFMLEDRAAGVTIEHQPDAEPIPTVAGPAASSAASIEPASRTPADIVRGTNGQPADDQT